MAGHYGQKSRITIVLVACRGCRRRRRPAICDANGKGLSMEWIVLAIVVAVAVYAIVIYNRLVRLRNMVREGFSGVDVQLRRRTDLVPNLVETVKAYAAHERTVLEDVAATRASSIAANDVPGQAAAARALQAALGKLFALAEAYPQLKADKNFLELRNQLAEIEDQLQMAALLQRHGPRPQYRD